MNDLVDVTGHNKISTDKNEIGKEDEKHERGPKKRKKTFNLSILYSMKEAKLCELRIIESYKLGLL